MYDTIFFDLDGTLTDSAPGILNSIRYALRTVGMEIPPEEALYRFVGPPLLTEFQAAFGVSREMSMEMVGHFRVYFTQSGMFENSVYDGIPAMLQRLRDSGRRAVVTTSKPEPFARQILERFDLAPYFDEIVGSGVDEKTMTTKYEVVAHAITLCGPKAPLLVGDRFHDVEGAHANGIPCMGVLYGYGSREELREAEYLAETVAELSDRLAGL